MDKDGHSFDSIARLYDEVRPGYPKEVYEIVSKYKKFSSESSILEIGAGQGIATKEIYEYWNSKITALEPGKNLFNIARSRFADYKNIKLVNQSFEEFEDNQKLFDGIFSASAFHWIDPNIKYRKSYKLLQKDGLLVVYWNNFSIENVEIKNKIQEIYKKYGFPTTGNKSSLDMQEEKIEKRKNEIDESGMFRIIDHQVIRRTINYSSERYIKLLRTFPDHAKEKIANIEGFFEEIAKLVSKEQDNISVKISVNLEIARKI
jgi:SAM-dependent methyltransferase